MIVSYIKKNLLLLVVLLVAVVLLALKFLKPKPSNKKENAVKRLQELGVSDTPIDYAQKSMLLAHHLGTAYAAYDPRSWSENDKEVFDIMDEMSLDTFTIVSDLYAKVYAKGNDLSSDLARLLDDELYKQLTVK